MAGLLFNKLNKFLAWAFFILCLCCGNFQCANADYSLKNLPETDLVKTLEKRFQGQSAIEQKDMTEEQAEKIQRARAILSSKKIPLTSEEFIKQISKNKIETVSLMLDAGMDPNTDYFGQYALFYAAKNNRTEIAHLLLSKGATPEIGFDSSLWWAVKHNSISLAQDLIKSGANVNYTDIASSNNVLYYAIKKKRYEIARLLIENGAKIDNKTAFLIQQKNLSPILGIQFKDENQN